MIKYIASKADLAHCVTMRADLPVIVLRDGDTEYDYLSLGPVAEIDINLGPYYHVYVGGKENPYIVWCV